MKTYCSIILTLSVSLILTSTSFADIKLPSVISDNMVLQQQTVVAIWGFADPGEKVTVKPSWRWFFGESTTANENGKWSVRLKTPVFGGPYTITFKGKNSITLSNVLIGEVWICSGQSNMSMPMQGWNEQPIEGAEDEIKNADFPLIRLYTVAPTATAEPAEDCESVWGWEKCSSESVEHFSAVAYFFGKKLYEELNVPIGLIHSSWGGTFAESWTRREMLDSDKDLKIFTEYIDKVLLEWRDEVHDSKTAGTPAPERPVPARNCPSYLYNGMLKPLIPYGTKGVIWYQGESNVGKSYQYRKLFPMMIKNWRDDWDIGDFPFYFVQLAAYVRHQPGVLLDVEKGVPVDNEWAELREAQLMTLKNVVNTGMAVAIDVGEANNIHPAKKKEVGQRLALWALGKDYGKDISYSGPIYKSRSIEDDRIRVRFDYAQCGLTAKRGKLEGFAIAGADRKFVWADAKIDGDTVVVHSQSVSTPVAVRYAWDTYPICNLYNKADLPASPFRTDDWPCITLNNK